MPTLRHSLQVTLQSRTRALPVIQSNRFIRHVNRSLTHSLTWCGRAARRPGPAADTPPCSAWSAPAAAPPAHDTHTHRRHSINNNLTAAIMCLELLNMRSQRGSGGISRHRAGTCAVAIAVEVLQCCSVAVSRGSFLTAEKGARGAAGCGRGDWRGLGFRASTGAAPAPAPAPAGGGSV
jgi:hypothetical protein